MAANAVFYPFRLKLDGSSDSICLRCFRTVHSTETMSLRESEVDHVCDEADLRSHGQIPSRRA